MSSSASILSTVTLAVFGILSFWIVGAIYTRFFTNETSCAALMFGVCAAAALVFYFLHDAGAIYAILLMSLMVAAMHGVNLVLIGYIPKRFYKIGRVSTVSGMINSCTYVGASISTYVVAKIAESAGWRFNIFVWFIVAFLGFLSCILVRGRWKKVLREEHLEEGESE